MLCVENLHKTFDGFVAVSSVDLTVDERETHALIGPNGAGKSTFFNLITGHLLPDRGTVTFGGEAITHMPPHRIVKKGIARSFQRINVFPSMSVFENVQVALIARNSQHYKLFVPSAPLHREEADELLNLVGLSEERHEVAGELAYGKQKQLELAIALTANPKLLLLDEPTAGMSARETFEAMELIRQITEERGLSLLFTEHDMTVVFGIARRISVLHHGEIIASGTPEEVQKDSEVRRVYLGGLEDDA